MKIDELLLRDYLENGISQSFKPLLPFEINDKSSEFEANVRTVLRNTQDINIKYIQFSVYLKLFGDDALHSIICWQDGQPFEEYIERVLLDKMNNASETICIGCIVRDVRNFSTLIGERRFRPKKHFLSKAKQ